MKKTSEFGRKTSEASRNIPKGMFRVIGLNFLNGTDYIVQDCNTYEEACQIAWEHNRRRETSWDDTYYVAKGN